MTITLVTLHFVLGKGAIVFFCKTSNLMLISAHAVILHLHLSLSHLSCHCITLHSPILTPYATLLSPPTLLITFLDLYVLVFPRT